MKLFITRILTVFLMVTYTAGAVGVTFSLHYCGKHFRYICFTEDTEKGCCGKNEHKSKCCTDKIVKAKIKDNHSYQAKATINDNWQPGVLPATQTYCWTELPEQVAPENFVSSDSSPPFVRSVPIYLANRVLRI